MKSFFVGFAALVFVLSSPIAPGFAKSEGASKTLKHQWSKAGIRPQKMRKAKAEAQKQKASVNTVQVTAGPGRTEPKQ